LKRLCSAIRNHAASPFPILEMLNCKR
jgi:hypothetical protein